MDLTNIKKRLYFGIQLLFAIIFFSVFVLYPSFAAANGEGIQEYQNNLHLNPLHKQKIADAIIRYRNADNLWDILREQFSLNHYEESYAVQAKIEWYMNNQDFLLRAASRAAPYLYYIHKQVRKRHLPAELVLLPIVESGYNPFSVSSVGASGLWQLMPGTASGLGVRRDWLYDGRLDIIASTRAALNYLAYLQSFFEGNWLLAIAAYNTGEGNVLAAIKRNIKEGRDTDFWSLPLAQQTRDYVPSLLALAIIISHPNQYPVYLPPVRNAPYLARIDVGKQINLKHAAKLAGISHRTLMRLNSGYKGETTLLGQYKLVLPIENVEQFSENLSRSILTKPLNWIHYKVKSGDTLLSISRKFSANIKDIRKLNHLNKNILHSGTHLLIPNQGGNENDSDEEVFTELLAENDQVTKKPGVKYNISKLIKLSKVSKIKDIIPVIRTEKSKPYKIHPGDTIYMVRKNDTITKIANQFRISIQSLKKTNQLASNHLTEGKHLFIPTHLKSLKKNTSSPRKQEKLLPGDTIYMVRRGDTLEKIAHKFKTTASAIWLTNLVNNENLKAGDNIIIPTHLNS